MNDAHPHEFPKLHNAIWPGVVGKGAGRRAGHRPRHDARPDGGRRGGRRPVRRRRPVPGRPARRHRRDRRRPEAGWPTRCRPRNLVIGSLVAPVWPPTGGGSAMGTPEERQRFPGPGPQGLPDRPEASRAGRAARRRRADRLGRASPATGRRIPRATRSASPRRSGRPATIAEDHGERLAAEGEICWGGMHSWKQDGRAARAGRPAGDARLPGRHGAHAALHARLQRARRTGILPEDFDWDDPAGARRGLRDTDRRRCGPGRSTSTSPRTTPPSRARARTTRPAGTAWPNDPNGKLDIARARRLLAARRRPAS